MVLHLFILSLRYLPFSNECRIIVPQREVDNSVYNKFAVIYIYMLVLTPQSIEFIDISGCLYQVIMFSQISV